MDDAALPLYEKRRRGSGEEEVAALDIASALAESDANGRVGTWARGDSQPVVVLRG